LITVDDPSLRQQILQSLEQHGDRVKSVHPLVGAIAAQVHSADVRLLADHPGVRFVSADARVSAGAAEQADIQQGGSYQNIASGSVGTQMAAGSFANSLRSTLCLQSFATSGPTGRGIGVALIDSGINPSADFAMRIRA